MLETFKLFRLSLQNHIKNLAAIMSKGKWLFFLENYTQYVGYFIFLNEILHEIFLFLFSIEKYMYRGWHHLVERQNHFVVTVDSHQQKPLIERNTGLY